MNELTLTKMKIFSDELFSFEWIEGEPKNSWENLGTVFSNELKDKIINFSKEKSLPVFYIVVEINNSVSYSYIDSGQEVRLSFPYFYKKEVSPDIFLSIFDSKEEKKADAKNEEEKVNVETADVSNDPVLEAIEKIKVI
jgi:hypothetical protein